jgi:beta-glucosidase
MLADGSFEELPSFEIKKYSPDAEPNTANPIKQFEEGWPVEFAHVGAGRADLDEFMTQFTDDELIDMVSGVIKRGVSNTSGIGGCLRLDVPAFMTCDGPAGVRLKPAVGIPTTSWPCATLLACTWEPALAEEFGRKGALEAKENGMAIWLSPALNIHRNPLCGRNFEYYSEDPLISGKFASAKVRGIQGEGLVATIKHFACNNKETNRRFSDSRVSERALREIYIRGFEICVNEADPWALMTAYNILNAVECAQNYELLQGILRDEWGYKGLVMSDWNTAYDQVEGIKAGLDVRMPWGEPELLKQALNDGRLTRAHLEKNVRRILEMFLKIK